MKNCLCSLSVRWCSRGKFESYMIPFRIFLAAMRLAGCISSV